MLNIYNYHVNQSEDFKFCPIQLFDIFKYVAQYRLKAMDDPFIFPLVIYTIILWCNREIALL